MMFKTNSPLVIVLLVLVLASDYQFAQVECRIQGGRDKRMADGKHHINLHSHMSRKVLERACAASKDVIDEIILCVTNNKSLMTSKSFSRAVECHKEAFGVDFDPKDLNKHHEEICKHRDKFENMVGCVYEKISAESTQKEMQELTEAMVDVGLCIVNALDA